MDILTQRRFNFESRLANIVLIWKLLGLQKLNKSNNYLEGKGFQRESGPQTTSSEARDLKRESGQLITSSEARGVEIESG